MPPETHSPVLMIIRHAEKPQGSAAPHGISEAGERDIRRFVVRVLAEREKRPIDIEEQ